MRATAGAQPDDAVNIRGLKRYAVEAAGDVNLEEPAPSTGKSVAIVGGGPSGLTAAVSWPWRARSHNLRKAARLGRNAQVWNP